MLAKKRPFEIDPFDYAQGRLRTLGTSSPRINGKFQL